jgi:WD40 repeat protein
MIKPLIYFFSLFFAVGLWAQSDKQPPRLIVPSTHGDTVRSIAITPSGRWAVTGTAKREVKVWDPATGAEMGALTLGKDASESLIGVYPRNDQQAYVVTSRRVTLLQLPSLRVTAAIDAAQELASASVSPDGDTLYIGGAEGDRAYVYALKRGRFPLRKIMERPLTQYTAKRDSAWVVTPHVSPAGGFAYMAEKYEGPLFLVSLENGQVLRQLTQRSPDKSESVAWNSMGQLVYSVASKTPGGSNELMIVEAESGAVLKRASLPAGAEHSFAPRQATTRNGTGALFVNNSAFMFWGDDAPEGPFRIGAGYIAALSAHPNGRYFVIASDDGDYNNGFTHQIRRFDRAKGAFSNPWSPPRMAAKVLAASPAGNAVFVSDRDKSGKLITLDGKGLRVSHLALDGCFDAVFAPAGDRLIYTYGSHERQVVTLPTHSPSSAQKRSLPFSQETRYNNGRLVASPSGNLIADVRPGRSDIEIQDTRTGKVVAVLKNGYYSYDEITVPAAFSKDERRVAVFTSERYEDGGFSVRCYELPTGRLIWKAPIPMSVGGIRFTPDDSELVVVGSTRSPGVYFVDPSNGSIKHRSDLTQNRMGARPAFNPSVSKVAHPNGPDLLVSDLRTGTELAKLTHPSQNATYVAWLGEKHIVSVSTDGSVRLWDTETASLLGTLVFSKAGEEWAFIHPSGRFEATAGSQTEMYFVQGEKKVPLSAYFESFYTPGLIAQLLAGENVQPPSIELKDLTEPPTVSLKLAGSTRNLVVEDAPEEVATETVTLAVNAESADSTISEIRLFQNGKRVESMTRNLVVEDDTQPDNFAPAAGRKQQNFTVALVPGENVFRAIALNAQRTESAPVELVVEYKAAKDAVAQTGRGGLQLHLLVIGINKYRNPKYSLNYAVPDASAVKAAIESRSTTIFTKVNVTTLFDAEATKAAMVAALEDIAKRAGPRDVFVFYYAGHGVMSSEPKPEFFLAPHELTQLYGADDLLRTKALSSGELLKYSQAIAAQKQLFLLDACQSAGALQVLAHRGAAEEKAIAQLARASGTHWITASGSEQFATEFEKLGHGTFTYALLQALAGKADNGDGRITVNELKAFLENQVPELTKVHKGTPQFPASYGFGQDFPVAVVK